LIEEVTGTPTAPLDGFSVFTFGGVRSGAVVPAAPVLGVVDRGCEPSRHFPFTFGAELGSVPSAHIILGWVVVPSEPVGLVIGLDIGRGCEPLLHFLVFKFGDDPSAQTSGIANAWEPPGQEPLVKLGIEPSEHTTETNIAWIPLLHLRLESGTEPFSHVNKVKLAFEPLVHIPLFGFGADPSSQTIIG
jgi:hypothetical protein